MMVGKWLGYFGNQSIIAFLAEWGQTAKSAALWHALAHIKQATTYALSFSGTQSLAARSQDTHLLKLGIEFERAQPQDTAS